MTARERKRNAPFAGHDAAVPRRWQDDQPAQPAPTCSAAIENASDMFNWLSFMGKVSKIRKDLKSIPFTKSDWRDFDMEDVAGLIDPNSDLYDARGAAATRLLAAGCRIAEIAAHMGWSIQTAHFTLQRYATANPTMAVGILDKLMAHEEKLKSAAAEVQDDEDHLIEDDEAS